MSIEQLERDLIYWKTAANNRALVNDWLQCENRRLRNVPAVRRFLAQNDKSCAPGLRILRVRACARMVA